MSMTDPIADMLTRIRNAGSAKHQKLDMPLSKVKLAIADVLKSTGYIKNFKVIEDDTQGVLRVYMKFDAEGAPVIHEITRVSKPGRRHYVGHDEVPTVKSGLGCAILTTCKGVVSDAQAREAGVGGEVVCTIW
jgi:small subunit ribosomal protein S8